MHRCMIYQFSVYWIHYCGYSESTGRKTDKSQLCASITKTIFSHSRSEPFPKQNTNLKLRLSVAAVITRVSNIGDEAGVGFLKDALTVVENVHRQFAGKLVNFLVHKFLVGPHLSLTRQAQCSNFWKVSQKKSPYI